MAEVRLGMLMYMACDRRPAKTSSSIFSEGGFPEEAGTSYLSLLGIAIAGGGSGTPATTVPETTLCGGADTEIVLFESEGPLPLPGSCAFVGSPARVSGLADAPACPSGPAANSPRRLPP